MANNLDKKTIGIIIGIISLFALTITLAYFFNLGNERESPHTFSVVDIGDGMYCEDSDGGYKPFKAGWVRLTVPSIGYTDDKEYDYCLNRDTVGEYSCDEDYGVVLQTYDCDAGCDDGACVECESHDEKKCSGNNVYWYDSCGDKEEVAEYCSNGCSGSKCVAVECEADSDCSSSSDFIKYCENNVLKQKKDAEKCESYKCVPKTSDEILEYCDYSCGVDNSGETKCLIQPTIQVFRVYDDSCLEISILPANKGPDDYDTLEDCEASLDGGNDGDGDGGNTLEIVGAIIVLVVLVVIVIAGFILKRGKKYGSNKMRKRV